MAGVAIGTTRRTFVAQGQHLAMHCVAVGVDNGCTVAGIGPEPVAGGTAPFVDFVHDVSRRIRENVAFWAVCIRFVAVVVNAVGIDPIHQPQPLVLRQFDVMVTCV